jgi:hypothetical protein
MHPLVARPPSLIWCIRYVHPSFLPGVKPGQAPSWPQGPSDVCVCVAVAPVGRASVEEEDDMGAGDDADVDPQDLLEEMSGDDGDDAISDGSGACVCVCVFFGGGGGGVWCLTQVCD